MQNQLANDSAVKYVIAVTKLGMMKILISVISYNARSSWRIQANLIHK